MRKFCTIALVLMTLLAFPVVVKVDEKTGEIVVEVEGMGQTFDSAKNDALRMAIEQGVGVAILGETYVKNQVPVSDEVLAKASGVVKTYEVLSKEFKDGFYYVKIRAVVMKAVVEKTLKDMLESVGNPKVLVLVKEETENGKEYSYFYTYLKKNLVDLGVYVLSPDYSRKILEAIEAEGGKVSVETARKFAYLANANYIIHGNVTYYTKYVSDYELWSVRVLADIEVIRTDNGRIVANEIVDEVLARATKEAAISILAKNFLPKIAERIGKKIVEDFQPKRSYELRFNVKKLSWGVKIKRWIEESGKFDQVIVKKRQRGFVVIQVTTSMSVDDLLEFVESCEIYDIYAEDMGDDWIEFTVEGVKQ